jgi:hypothetical protein
MKKTLMLAETPRGGPYGHRFLVPPDSNLKSSDVEDYFQRASQGGNTDFIAAKRQVEQRLPNGAIREGTETLLLTGINVTKLAQQQSHEIHQVLARRLADLEQLVTTHINWEETGNKTIIIRKELADWWSQDLITSMTPSKAEQQVKDHKDIQTGSIVGILVGLATGIISLFIWFY